ncbi:hypothetical protein NKH18_40505 [Streptomyces sp. M10(2022)]
MTDEDFVRAIHETAYQHTAESARMPSVRLSLALMVLADGDDPVQRALAETYRGYLSSWKQVYAEVLQARGLRLRAGLGLDDLANALSAATDGVILRSIGDPHAEVVVPERQSSLMGTVALAVIHGFLEPADDSDGLTLEQAVRATLGRSLPSGVTGSDALRGERTHDIHRSHLGGTRNRRACSGTARGRNCPVVRHRRCRPGAHGPCRSRSGCRSRWRGRRRWHPRDGEHSPTASWPGVTSRPLRGCRS